MEDIANRMNALEQRMADLETKIQSQPTMEQTIATIQQRREQLFIQKHPELRAFSNPHK